LRIAAKRVLPGTAVDPLYPDWDGRFMGDTDFHSLAMVLLRQGLEDYFADVDDVYVGMNLVLYFVQGEPAQRRDPDILVAKGVAGKHPRRSFRVWEEKTFPRTLMEIVSEGTVDVDVEEKRLQYERFQIPEYFLFDPEGEYLDPVLRGFRLARGKYVELQPAEDGSLISEELGLRLLPEGIMLRLIELKTGKPVLTRAEQAARALEQARLERRKTRAARRQAATERQKAEDEKHRAAEEKQRADQEQQRAATLAAEVQRLQALLRAQNSPGEIEE
jgi:Uma2 family endonuclease